MRVVPAPTASALVLASSDSAPTPAPRLSLVPTAAPRLAAARRGSTGSSGSGNESGVSLPISVKGHPGLERRPSQANLLGRLSPQPSQQPSTGDAASDLAAAGQYEQAAALIASLSTAVEQVWVGAIRAMGAVVLVVGRGGQALRRRGERVV
jgi:hypothetical protein